MFPGETSQHFSLGRTKASYLFSDGLGPFLVRQLAQVLNDSECGYTLMLDETTTAQVVKQLDILVRFWCDANEEVQTKYLSSIFFGRAPAEDLLDMILQEIEDSSLSTEKLFDLSVDGPNINKSLWKKLDSHLKGKCLGGLLPLITCTIHIIHNGFRKGLNVYGQEAEELTFDLYYWFRMAPCKREDFRNLEEELDLQLHESLFLRHIEARWLTLVPALERVLSRFPRAEKYFLEFLPQKKEYEKTLPNNKRFQRVQGHLKNKAKVSIQIIFLTECAPMFNDFMLKFQSVGPMIHVLHSELKAVLLQLLRRIVSAEKVNGLSGRSLKTLKLDDSVLLPPEDCYVGPKTEEALRSVSPHDARVERRKMRDHYLAVAQYFQKKFPLDSIVLRDLSALHPQIFMQESTVKSIERLAKLLPHVLPVEEIPKLIDEWKSVQAESIDRSWYEEDFVDKEGQSSTRLVRVDHFWRKVFHIKLHTGLVKYTVLPKVVKTLLSIHHGNADVERSLSDNKKVVTGERVRLGEPTIRGLRRTKELARGVGGACNIPFGKEMADAVKNSHRVYTKRLEDEAKEKLKQQEKFEVAKRKREEEESQRRELKKMEERKERGVQCISILEQDLDAEYEAAAKLIGEGSKRLSLALSTKDMSEVTIATALVDSANKKMAAVQEKKDALSIKRKQVDKRTEAIVRKLKKN